MKLHFGQIKNPVRLVTNVGGYRLIGPGDTERYVERPAEVTRKVRRMFGVSAGRWFVGTILCDAPKMN